MKTARVEYRVHDHDEPVRLPETFPCNDNGNVRVSVINRFMAPIRARFVRIIPVTWQHRATFRAGLLASCIDLNVTNYRTPSMTLQQGISSALDIKEHSTPSKVRRSGKRGSTTLFRARRQMRFLWIGAATDSDPCWADPRLQFIALAQQTLPYLPTCHRAPAVCVPGSRLQSQGKT